jgi:hypothetical protein
VKFDVRILRPRFHDVVPRTRVTNRESSCSAADHCARCVPASNMTPGILDSHCCECDEYCLLECTAMSIVHKVSTFLLP